jgi:hypothetical protein
MARWLVLVAASIVASIVASGCYNEPRPACGFVCGEAASCPTGYTCSAADNRCHLDGTSVQCDSYVDAGPDTAVDADTTPPTVIMMSPAPNDENVALDATVVATFSEPVIHVDPMTGFRLDWSRGFFPGTVAPTGTNPFGEVYTPNVPFPGSTVITATVTTAVTDNAGNPLATNARWSFRTVPDPVAPVVTMTMPMNGDTNVPIDTAIEVTFSKAIGAFSQTSIAVDHGVTGTIAIAGNFDLKLTPSVPLAAATTYNVTVATDVADLSGNQLAAPFTFSFTTM